MQKYKLNANKFALGLKKKSSSPSLSQATSKKILDQIKKRRNQSRSNSKSPANSNMNNSNNRHPLPKKEENPDDDCICVENKPEVILIDDETPAPLNVVQQLEQKYLKFKHYEPIGSIRLNQFKDTHKTNHMLTSTPNHNRLHDRTESREPFNQETAPLNVVQQLEQKYLKYKQYEPIGSIRLNQFKNTHKTNHMFTSTPNHNRLHDRTESREPFNQETDSSFGSLTSATICYNADDVTIVEDVLPQRKVNVSSAADDVIVIEDTIVPRRSRTPQKASKRNRSRNNNNNNDDDSVIFVSDTRKSPKPAPAFIPLDTPPEEIQVKLAPIPSTSPRPKRQRKNDLFTTREEKQLKQYNDNAYNPDKDSSKEEIPTKRMVIIDGSNVAYQHALNKEFSVKGLKICLDYFHRIGHEVKAVVPQFRLQRAKSSDPDALENLHREGKIVFTPCKNLPGKSSQSYDDRFILQLASELDAAVVSNDNYRDLIHENSALRKIIENRVIGYTWCNDVFILPKDPYGKFGPSLASILNRS